MSDRFQVIQHIHLFALCPNFPLSHPQIHATLSDVTPRYIGEYLYTLHANAGQDRLLVRAVRHPVCSVEAVHEIQSLSARRPQKQDSDHKPGALTCDELPRRLFRSSLCREGVHPLLIHLCNTYHSDPNRHGGYALCRATLCGNHDLVSFLLAQGADPSLKSSMAIQLAIRKRDLQAVKLLTASMHGDRRKRRNVALTPALMEHAMIEGSNEIVSYLVQEKGASRIMTTEI